VVVRTSICVCQVLSEPLTRSRYGGAVTFGTVILLGKKEVNKLKKLLKLGSYSGALGGLGKVGFKVSFIWEGLYLGNSIVDTFKDRI